MGYEAASSVAVKDEAVSPSAIEMVLKKSVEVEPLLDTDIFVSSIKKNEPSSPESDSSSDNSSASKSSALPPSHSADEPKSRPVPSIAKPVTPITKSTPAISPSSFVYDVLLWKQIPRSAFYFILGGLALELTYRLASSLTLLSAVSYLLLGSLAINFSRTLISGKLIVSPWSSSSCLGASLRFLTAVINAVASTHDSYLNGQDALVTSKAALFLWAASLVTRQFSILTLLRIAHLAAFSLPLTYVTKKKQINVAFESALAQGKKHYVTINPKVKLGAFSFVFLVLVCFLPVLDKAAVSLIFLSFLAHVSKTSDIAGFRRRMVPVARVVNSAYDNIFKICATAVNKYEILPVPIKVDVRKKIQ